MKEIYTTYYMYRILFIYILYIYRYITSNMLLGDNALFVVVYIIVYVQNVKESTKNYQKQYANLLRLSDAKFMYRNQMHIYISNTLEDKI